MIDLKNYCTVVNEARTKKWPENEKQLEKEPEIKNATDAEDISPKDLKKIKTVGPRKVAARKSAKENGTHDRWDIDRPFDDWEKQLAELNIDELDNNLYEISQRLDDGQDFLVLGEAGWAKTASITAMAQKHGYHVLTVYLDKAAATDLGGIPIPRDENGKMFMDYTVPGWAMEIIDHPENKYLLFFDEMNQAAPDVMNALMPIVLKHVVCSIRIPNMIVGAAGNLAKENQSLEELNKPLSDRFEPIIEWETHTDETWGTAFQYFHDKWDNKLGKQIIDKLEQMSEYWDSPRHIERILLGFAGKEGDRDARKYSRASSIKKRIWTMVWHELDEDIKSSKKFSTQMDELADYISKFIQNGSKPLEDKPKETRKRGGIDMNDLTIKTIMSALEHGYFLHTPEEGGNGEMYICSKDNVITEIFDPSITGITAEILEKIIKKMNAAGKKVKYEKKSDCTEAERRRNGLLDPAAHNGEHQFLMGNVTHFNVDDYYKEKPTRAPRRAQRPTD